MKLQADTREYKNATSPGVKTAVGIVFELVLGMRFHSSIFRVVRSPSNAFIFIASRFSYKSA